MAGSGSASWSIATGITGQALVVVLPSDRGLAMVAHDAKHRVAVLLETRESAQLARDLGRWWRRAEPVMMALIAPQIARPSAES